jgi:hypothetical protein
MPGMMIDDLRMMNVNDGALRAALKEWGRQRSRISNHQPLM